MGKCLALLGLPPTTSPGPLLGQAFPPLWRGPLSCSLRVRGPERRPQHSVPRWTPGQWGSERIGGCWVLTSQSGEAGATAMQASWGPSSTSRCLRNVLSWELPRSFPHHPQPRIPSYACSPHPLPLSSLPGRASCPLSLWYLATAQFPRRPRKGSLKEPFPFYRPHGLTMRGRVGGTGA